MAVIFNSKIYENMKNATTVVTTPIMGRFRKKKRNIKMPRSSKFAKTSSLTFSIFFIFSVFLITPP